MSIHSRPLRFAMGEHPVTTTVDSAAETARTAAEEIPPLGSWARLYAIVLGELLVLIVLFTLFARAFS